MSFKEQGSIGTFLIYIEKQKCQVWCIAMQNCISRKHILKKSL